MMLMYSVSRASAVSFNISFFCVSVRVDVELPGPLSLTRCVCVLEVSECVWDAERPERKRDVKDLRFGVGWVCVCVCRERERGCEYNSEYE